MESSVFKSSAYYQHCCSDFSLAHGDKNDIGKKTAPGLWLKTENTVIKKKYRQLFLSIVSSVSEWKRVWDDKVRTC